MADELEITIGPTGEIHVVTKNVTGKRCLDYVALFQEIAGDVTEQHLTPNFYQDGAETEIHQHQNTRY